MLFEIKQKQVCKVNLYCRSLLRHPCLNAISIRWTNSSLAKATIYVLGQQAKKREPSTLMALTIQLCFWNKIKLGCHDGKTYKWLDISAPQQSGLKIKLIRHSKQILLIFFSRQR